MTTILLVHGTFAPNAAWTLEASELRAAIEALKLKTTARCVPFQWSGANLQSHRDAAASGLYAEVKRCITDRPGEKIFIVAHSHGGTVTNRMLTLFPDVAELLSGVVYLSTPFIFAARRSYANILLRMSEHLLVFGSSVLIWLPILYLLLHWENSPDWIFNAGCIAASASCSVFWDNKLAWSWLPGVTFGRWLANFSGREIGLISASCLAAFGYAVMGDAFWPTWLRLPMAAVVFAAVLFAAFKALDLMKIGDETVSKNTHISASLERSLADFRQTTMAANKALYIRFTSDEATLSLALAQGFAKFSALWIKVLLVPWTVASTKYWQAWRSGMAWGQKVLWVFLFAAMMALFALPTVVVFAGLLAFIEVAAVSLYDALTHLKLPDSWHWSDSTMIMLANSLFDRVHWLSIPIPDHLQAWFNLAMMALILAPTCLAALLSLAFGSAYFWAAPYLDFSVEAVPLGQCQLVTFEPPLNTEDSKAWSPWQSKPLAHSLSYSDPRSIDLICRWVEARASAE